MGRIWHIVATPSFWGTVLGIAAIALGSYLIGGLLLVAVGYGGCGISLSLGVTADKDPWRVDTCVEAVLNSLRGHRDECLVGLLTHLPQAVIGTIALVGGC